MKRTAISILMFLLISCTKSNSPATESLTESSIQKIQEILEMPNYSLQKISYRLLDSKEKAEVWKKHLQKCINEMRLTLEQKKLTNEIYIALNPETFNASKLKEIIDQNEIFKYRVAKIFPEKLRYIFYSLIISQNDYTSMQKGVTPTFVAPPPDCDCRSDEPNHCNWSGEMPPEAVCTKDFNKCKHTDGGCGWLWLSNCDGTCESLGN